MQNNPGQFSSGFRCLFFHHAFRDLAPVCIHPDSHGMPAASFVQESITVAVDHQPPCERDCMRPLSCNRITDHSFVFFCDFYCAGLFQVTPCCVFLRSGQLLHQQRIQSHAFSPGFEISNLYSFSFPYLFSFLRSDSERMSWKEQKNSLTFSQAVWDLETQNFSGLTRTAGPMVLER